MCTREHGVHFYTVFYGTASFVRADPFAGYPGTRVPGYPGFPVPGYFCILNHLVNPYNWYTIPGYPGTRGTHQGTPITFLLGQLQAYRALGYPPVSYTHLRAHETEADL
eukprot:2686223-Rhodomonas_salina.1